MSDIFISYSREDRPRAKRIAEELERRGWSVWWDRMIPAGQVFDEVIEEEIEAAKCIVVLWSSHSIGSRWVRSEASEGVDRQILVPVLIEEVQVPLAFKRIQTADLTRWGSGASSTEFERLVADISAITGLARTVIGEQEEMHGEEASLPLRHDNERPDEAGPDAEITEKGSDRSGPLPGKETTAVEQTNDDGHPVTSPANVGERSGVRYGLGVLTVLILVALGYFLITSLSVQQSAINSGSGPVPAGVHENITGPRPASVVLSSLALRDVMVKFHKRETKSGQGRLKAADIVENGTVVPVTLSTDIDPGHHAFIVSQNNCWYATIENSSRAVIREFSLRLNMGKTDELVGLSTTGKLGVNEARKKVRVEIGGGVPCSQLSKASLMTAGSKALLDNAVHETGHSDGGMKLKAKMSEDGLTIKSLLKHPMETRHYIEYLGVYLNDKPIAYYSWSPLVSKNPLVDLDLEGSATPADAVKIAWLDNLGNIAVSLPEYVE